MKKKQKLRGVWTDDKERCEVCGVPVEHLAEFNRRHMCGKCFQLMIQARVGVKDEAAIITDIPENNETASNGKEIELQVC